MKRRLLANRIHPCLRCAAFFVTSWFAFVLAACSGGSVQPASMQDQQGAANSGGVRASSVSSGGAGNGAADIGAGGGGGGLFTIPTASSIPAPSLGGVDALAGCGSVTVDAKVETKETVVEVPGNVLFIFDRSQSMAEGWKGKPKWKSAYDAVVGAFAPLQDKLNAGAVLFPEPSKTHPDSTSTPPCDWTKDFLGCLSAPSPVVMGCPDVLPITSPPQMPIQPGRAFLTAWNAFWAQGENALAMGTPTEKALLEGERALATPPPGNTVVVLLTDGEPTCGSNESAVAARLRQKSIKTFVVGLPGSSSGTKILDKIAAAGDTATAGCTSNCFLTPLDPMELQSALAAIATTTVTTTTVTSIDNCTFQLQAPANVDPASVHLVATRTSDGQQYQIPRVAGKGWTLAADCTRATLEAELCTAAKAGAFTSFSFHYGCVTAPPIVL